MPSPSRRKPGLPAAAIAALLAAAGALVAEEEGGFILSTYADPIWGERVPTVCAGQTGPAAKFGITYTVEECIGMLDFELRKKWGELEQCIDRPEALRPNEAVAILSWAYNVGTAAACSSTLVRMVNRGEPETLWCAQLDRWTRADGRVVRGLVNRRARERAICEGQHDPNLSDSGDG